MMSRICSRAWRDCAKASAEHVDGQAAALHVHLDGGDALAGAGDLEVHVAAEVLDALDVGQELAAVLIAHHPDGDAGDGRR